MTFDAFTTETLETANRVNADLRAEIARRAYRTACQEIGEIDYETITYPLAERAAQIIGWNTDDIIGYL